MAENVWVLVIDHRHGTDSSVHRTEGGAREALHSYVVQFWDEVVGRHGLADKMPEDPSEAIDAYFEAMEDEGYTLGPAELGE